MSSQKKKTPRCHKFSPSICTSATTHLKTINSINIELDNPSSTTKRTSLLESTVKISHWIIINTTLDLSSHPHDSDRRIFKKSSIPMFPYFPKDKTWNLFPTSNRVYPGFQRAFNTGKAPAISDIIKTSNRLPDNLRKHTINRQVNQYICPEPQPLTQLSHVSILLLYLINKAHFF